MYMDISAFRIPKYSKLMLAILHLSATANALEFRFIVDGQALSENPSGFLLERDALHRTSDLFGSRDSLAKLPNVMFNQNRKWTAPRVPVSHDSFGQ